MKKEKKQQKRKNRPFRIGQVIGIICMIAGSLIFAYPDIAEHLSEKQNEELIQKFEQVQESGTAEEPEDTAEETSDSTEDPGYDIIEGTDALWEEISAYNTEIYENDQMDFKDAWTAAQTPVAVDLLKDGMFGYIEIPTMNCTLPLYIGASSTHMGNGAAVLGGTSVPIGGENTNSVIAGHRGWKSMKYFKEIEQVQVGDPVYITNPWATLTYRVESIAIIGPRDSDKVRIQEGKDMVTLITCHPYRSHGKKRYVLYCVRDESLAPAEEIQGTVETPQKDISASEPYTLSSDDIHTEDTLRRICATGILGMAVFAILLNVIRSRKETLSGR